MPKRKVDILVIGAGPSGCVAASIINKNNMNVIVLEKQQLPRFVIGESLLPRSMEHFEEAGFLDALNTRNYEKKLGARFIKNGKECLFDFSKVYTKGWTWTWQVPRSDFDQVMANETERMGVEILWQTAVTDISFSGTNSTTTIEDKNGKISQIEAKFVIDSSGYGRVLPRLLNLEETSSLSAKTALFTHCKETRKPQGITGSQITFTVHKKDVWIWYIPFSNGITSLGVVGNSDFINSFKGTNEEKLRTILEEDDNFNIRFRDVEYLFDPLTIPNYSVAVKQLYGEGFAITGNSAEFLDPVFSSGVCFATESGSLAAKLAVKQLKGNYVDWEKEFAQHIKYGVNVFRSYVNAWYEGSLQTVFFAKNENLKIKAQICSVLAGYVWDTSNPFVSKHQRAVKALANVIELEENTI